MLNFTISTNTVEEAIAEMKALSSALGGLPPMQEQPNREPVPAEPKTRKSRTTKEAGEAEAGKSDANAASTANEPKSVTATAADAESGSAASAFPSEIPDIATVRAALLKLSSTDGFGHDKVFETLGKFGAKNASTVPEDKRAALVAEIEAMLKAGPAK